MPSLLSHLVPLFLRATGANRTFLSADAAAAHMAERGAHPASFAPPRRMRDDVVITRDHQHGWPVFTLTPRDTAPRGAVVYLHGGAWVNEVAPQHWQLCAQLAAEAGTTVILPIYPLVPHGTAAAVSDVVVELVLAARAAHGDASLAGDSAGGQIALSAAIRLRDEHGVTLPQTVLIAPSLDLSMKNPLMDVVQPSDPWLGKPGARVFIESWRGELAIDDPRVSPLEGDLAGLGPLTVFSGTRDILNPDIRLLVQKARDAGVAVEFHERAGLVHVYPLTPTPEGRGARDAIVRKLRVP